MAGSLLITSDSTASSQNISSTLELATLTASADGWVTPSVRLSSLNGAAATITLTARHYASNGTTLIREQAYSFAKPRAASTVAGDDMPAVFVKSGEKLTIAAKSTNASDSSVTYTISWANSAASDMQLVVGTAQTARDLGASVLLSSGTGTGQLDFTSGVVKASLAQILGTAITGTAAQLAAAFTKFFNVVTPTGTVNSLPDAVPGASGGLSIVGSAMTLATGSITAAVIATGAIDADALATDALVAIANKVESEIIDDTDSEKVLTAITDKIASVNPDLGGLTLSAIASAVWANGTRVLTAGTNIVLAKGTGVTGFTDLDAAAVRTALGLATANLDTQLGAIDDYIDSEVAAIKAKTDQLVFTTTGQVDATAVTLSDKTGLKLASDGLDSISLTEASGVPTNLREWVLWLLARRGRRRVVNNGTQLLVYRANGTTVMTTQTITSGAGTDDLSAAT